jgi:hypothetical protein
LKTKPQERNHEPLHRLHFRPARQLNLPASLVGNEYRAGTQEGAAQWAGFLWWARLQLHSEASMSTRFARSTREAFPHERFCAVEIYRQPLLSRWQRPLSWLLAGAMGVWLAAWLFFFWSA